MKRVKLRLEITPDGEEEVIIRCRSLNDTVRRLENAVAEIAGTSAEIKLTLAGEDHFVNYGRILFFETVPGKTAAHTAEGMYYTEYKLYELEKLLPPSFVRISKSGIVNSALVFSIAKNLTGASEIRFRGCTKKTYVSRSYYRNLMHVIEETRLLK